MFCAAPNAVLAERPRDRGFGGTAIARRDDDIEQATARLDAGPDALRAAAALLCDAERERARRFIFERERRRYIVARARLRELLAARLEIRPETVEFVYGPRGKPALAPRLARSGLCFNVSHCGDAAVY